MSNDDIRNRPQVVLVLRAIIINRNKLLLVKRNKFERYEPEKWEFPGGKLERFQNIYEAIVDEVDQETGLKIEIESKIAFVDGHINDAGSPYRDLPYVVIFFLSKLINDSQKIKLSHEHDEFEWVETAEALSMDLKDEDRNAIKGLLVNTLV